MEHETVAVSMRAKTLQNLNKAAQDCSGRGQFVPQAAGLAGFRGLPSHAQWRRVAATHSLKLTCSSRALTRGGGVALFATAPFWAASACPAKLHRVSVLAGGSQAKLPLQPGSNGEIGGSKTSSVVVSLLAGLCAGIVLAPRHGNSESARQSSCRT